MALREILNESGQAFNVWMLDPILGNDASGFQAILDGKAVQGSLVSHRPDRSECDNAAVLPLLATSTFPDRPHLFVPLGEIPPDGKRRIEVSYDAEGILMID